MHSFKWLDVANRDVIGAIPQVSNIITNIKASQRVEDFDHAFLHNPGMYTYAYTRWIRFSPRTLDSVSVIFALEEDDHIQHPPVDHNAS